MPPLGKNEYFQQCLLLHFFALGGHANKLFAFIFCTFQIMDILKHKNKSFYSITITQISTSMQLLSDFKNNIFKEIQCMPLGCMFNFNDQIKQLAITLGLLSLPFFKIVTKLPPEYSPSVQ